MKTWPFRVQQPITPTPAVEGIPGIEVIDLDPTLALQIIEATSYHDGSDENMGSEALNRLIVSSAHGEPL